MCYKARDINSYHNTMHMCNLHHIMIANMKYDNFTISGKV